MPKAWHGTPIYANNKFRKEMIDLILSLNHDTSDYGTNQIIQISSIQELYSSKSKTFILNYTFKEKILPILSN